MGNIHPISLFLPDFATEPNRTDELHYETRQILQERSWPTPEPFGSLQPLLTSIYLLLLRSIPTRTSSPRRAIAAHGPAPGSAYSEKRQLEDVPADNNTGGRSHICHAYRRQ
jgi:hypothetical protein